MMTRSEGLTTINWFNCLCNIIRFPNLNDYRQILWHLYNVEFWFEDVTLDANRVQDAIDLRERHGVRLNKDISILEVMAALVVRCDTSFLYDPKVGYRMGFWFEQMLCSLGLSEYPDWQYDENTVNDILDTFLHRRYAPNGKGGLFTLKHPRENLIYVDIWMQAMWWFNEYEEDCDKVEKYYGEEA